MKARLFAAAAGFALAISGSAAQARTHGSHVHHAHGQAGVSMDRSCLVPAARALLERIEANFGQVNVISTCRAHAVVAGSHRPSLHRYGLAIDFKTSRKAEVVRWLMANNPGGTMTYRNHPHIHADVGPHFIELAGRRIATGGVGRRTFAMSMAHGRARHAAKARPHVDRTAMSAE